MAQIPRLLLITEPDPASGWLTVLPTLSRVVDAVLLRWPSTPARDVLALARAATATRPRPPVWVSDRVDIALAIGAEGVQLKEGGLPAHRVRESTSLCVGASWHPTEGRPAPVGANYLLVSPVFPTASKPAAQALGLARLARECADTDTPVLALGGIDVDRARACRGAGAYGVAVMSAVWTAADPARAAREIRKVFD